MSHKSGWFDAKYSDNAVFSLKIRDHLYSCKSRFQKIDIFDSVEFGKILALDDIINVTERDEFIYHEMLVHVPLLSHPDPGTVIVVGGGDGGCIREIVKHPTVTHAHLVEIDKEVVDVSKKYFPGVSCGLDDRRVSIFYDDAARYIQHVNGEADIIIVDSTDPAGDAEKLFGYDFYTSCYNALSERGILAAQSESPFFDPSIVKRLCTVAKRVFPVVRMYIAFMPSYVSGIWSFLYCSKNLDPVEHFQYERYRGLGLKTGYYNSDIHTASFSLPSFIRKQFDL